MRKGLLILLCLSVVVASGGGDSDCVPENAAHVADKYSREVNFPPSWKRRLAEMDEAKAEWQQQQRRNSDSDQEECSFYEEFIERDLAVFGKTDGGGITEAMLAAARDKNRNAVTYKIVAGRLYRSRDCLFPLRCKGIEHFLLEMAEEDAADTELVVNTQDWPHMNR